jgi:hypothetical protein
MRSILVLVLTHPFATSANAADGVLEVHLGNTVWPNLGYGFNLGSETTLLSESGLVLPFDTTIGLPGDIVVDDEDPVEWDASAVNIAWAGADLNAGMVPEPSIGAQQVGGASGLAWLPRPRGPRDQLARNDRSIGRIDTRARMTQRSPDS